MTFDASILKAYFVCGSQDVDKNQLVPTVEAAITAGITAFQFRDKGAQSTLTPTKRLKQRNNYAISVLKLVFRFLWMMTFL